MPEFGRGRGCGCMRNRNSKLAVALLLQAFMYCCFVLISCFAASAQTSSPTITSLSPTQGSNSGGDTISIYGRNFVSGAKVTIGGISVNATVSSSTLIKAVTPAMTAGSTDVRVTNPNGQSATLASWLHNQGFESGLTYWK